jgi:tRNA C32,U32 (ribose-2'-O)-methylase TrmJ
VSKYESEPTDLEFVGSRTGVWAKGTTPKGQSPAIALINPRYAHNVGGAVRAASCFDAKQVWWTGSRVMLDPAKGERLPREERMKGYKAVTLVQFDHVFDQFGPDITPVAVELLEFAESLPDFIHPENALYVFGPEDGSLSRVELIHCHRFVTIPTAGDPRPFCVNLAAAVYMVLYDRMVKERRKLEVPS